MIDNEIIQTAVDRLVSIYSPEEIYIFGSYAWGQPTDDSDLDLLVVVRASEDKPHRRPVKGLLFLKDLKIPKDLVVFTKKEFDLFSADKTSLLHTIRAKGKKVYGSSS